MSALFTGKGLNTKQSLTAVAGIVSALFTGKGLKTKQSVTAVAGIVSALFTGRGLTGRFEEKKRRKNLLRVREARDYFVVPNLPAQSAAVPCRQNVGVKKGDCCHMRSPESVHVRALSVKTRHSQCVREPPVWKVEAGKKEVGRDRQDVVLHKGWQAGVSSCGVQAPEGGKLPVSVVSCLSPSFLLLV